jgi:hypothetical protein
MSAATTCNGSGPHRGDEVRLLPHTKTPLHGNDILCRACFEREIEYRRERNRSLGDFAKYDTPAWEDCKLYETE